MRDSSPCDLASSGKLSTNCSGVAHAIQFKQGPSIKYSPDVFVL